MAGRGITFSAPMVRALLDGRKTQTRRLAPQPPAECSINYMLGNESWLAADKRTPVRRTFEAWGGPLFDAKPDKALCGSFDIVPRHQPGDRLYVREHWKTTPAYDDLAPRDMGGDEPLRYLADDATFNWGEADGALAGRHRQARHMPRWASRLTLLVTDVRVQRLQDISEADARAEGVERWRSACGSKWFRNYLDPEDAFEQDYMNHPLLGPEGSGPAKLSFSTLWNSLHTDPGARWEDNPWIYAVSFDVRRENIDQIGETDD